MEGPRFVRYFGPVLQALETLGGSGRPSEVRTMIAQRLLVPEQELLEALPSGGQSRFDNQVAWARFYLVKAGYIDASRRGVWSLTEKGRSGLGMTHTEALQLFKEVHATFATPEEVAVNEETVIPAAEPLSPAASAPTTNQAVAGFVAACPAHITEYDLRGSKKEESSIIERLTAAKPRLIVAIGPLAAQVAREHLREVP